MATWALLVCTSMAMPSGHWQQQRTTQQVSVHTNTVYACDLRVIAVAARGAVTLLLSWHMC